MSDKTDTPRTDALEYAITNFPDKVATARFMRDMERELTKWREVAGRLAEQLKACDRFICGREGHFVGLCAISDAIKAYDALAQQARKGEG